MKIGAVVVCCAVVLGLFLVPVIPIYQGKSCSALNGCSFVIVEFAKVSITYAYLGVGIGYLWRPDVAGHYYCLMAQGMALLCTWPDPVFAAAVVLACVALIVMEIVSLIGWDNVWRKARPDTRDFPSPVAFF